MNLEPKIIFGGIEMNNNIKKVKAHEWGGMTMIFMRYLDVWIVLIHAHLVEYKSRGKLKICTFHMYVSYVINYHHLCYSSYKSIANNETFRLTTS